MVNQYCYRKLQNLHRIAENIDPTLRETYNTYGLIYKSSIINPNPSYFDLLIKDESGNATVSIRRAGNPNIPNFQVGDVLRIHRGYISLYNRKLQIRVARVDSLVIFPKVGGFNNPISTAANPTIEAREEAIIRELLNLQINQTPNAIQHCLSSVKEGVPDCDIISELIGFQILNNNAACVAFVWDGTQIQCGRLKKFKRWALDNDENLYKMDEALFYKTRKLACHLWLYDNIADKVSQYNPGTVLYFEKVRVAFNNKTQELYLTCKGSVRRLEEGERNTQIFRTRLNQVPIPPDSEPEDEVHVNEDPVNEAIVNHRNDRQFVHAEIQTETSEDNNKATEDRACSPIAERLPILNPLPIVDLNNPIPGTSGTCILQPRTLAKVIQETSQSLSMEASTSPKRPLPSVPLGQNNSTSTSPKRPLPSVPLVQNNSTSTSPKRSLPSVSLRQNNSTSTSSKRPLPLGQNNLNLNSDPVRNEVTDRSSTPQNRPLAISLAQERNASRRTNSTPSPKRPSPNTNDVETPKKRFKSIPKSETKRKKLSLRLRQPKQKPSTSVGTANNPIIISSDEENYPKLPDNRSLTKLASLTVEDLIESSEESSVNESMVVNPGTPRMETDYPSSLSSETSPEKSSHTSLNPISEPSASAIGLSQLSVVAHFGSQEDRDSSSVMKSGNFMCLRGRNVSRADQTSTTPSSQSISSRGRKTRYVLRPKRTSKVAVTSNVRNTVAGTPNVRNKVAGPSNGQNTVAGTSNVQNTIAGTSNVQNTIAGTSNVQNTVAGTSNVQNTVAGTSNVQNTVAGTSNVQNTVAGTSNVQNTVAGTSNVQKTVAGTSNVQNTVAGPSNVQNTGAGLSNVKNISKKQRSTGNANAFPVDRGFLDVFSTQSDSSQRRGNRHVSLSQLTSPVREVQNTSRVPRSTDHTSSSFGSYSLLSQITDYAQQEGRTRTLVANLSKTLSGKFKNMTKSGLIKKIKKP